MCNEAFSEHMRHGGDPMVLRLVTNPYSPLGVALQQALCALVTKPVQVAGNEGRRRFGGGAYPHHYGGEQLVVRVGAAAANLPQSHRRRADG
jgi:hypothetical protein